ncbi:TMEM165/GDT1 family protein [Wenzhouxiangella sp. AB-CW3]|uniref:TMEM165/GDT1 family protein n=1 Tax=Wenzhouxiangella sp. AB-CW3 TaxID=2771012 RepID=UPI00168A7068|nr:TMEM165/GDT1 family protein [Wenzhouxiangella sp. AB-CW3]QOC23064.1 TMEM165/GDT1 family protein [Wenzhouxiangella sp. AB-CW3]
MEPLFIAMAIIAIAELGDKTQLLALMLSSRFRRPVAVAAGMSCALIVMHLLAAFGGAWIEHFIPDRLLKSVVAIGFLLIAAWTVLSRARPSDTASVRVGAHSAFVTSLIAFVVMEMGDKSQLATIGLAIAFEPAWQVGLGAAAGGIVVNLPVIWAGWKLERRIPHRLFHWASAILFSIIGLWLLAEQVILYGASS